MLSSSKDSQLWSDDADCFVHFYASGTSQRGASLCVPYQAIKKLNCPYLTDYCLQSRIATPPFDGKEGRDSGYASARSNISVPDRLHNLHIPAPLNLSRDEAFTYHLTTRNVVAYAVGKPVVGERLSTALIGLWKRLRDWAQGRASRADFTAYLRQQGYLNFTENAEHALACLKFAEEVHFRDVWIDAFSHCAGMHERLDLSPEFAGVSKTTTALLTRASLEMDLHIGRVMKALSGFLEEELGPDQLGLSKPARDHLDHFRSFLHAYYVDRLGWYPPPQRHVWNKRPWRDMYHDFHGLFDYLVDRESSLDWTSNRVVTGGICVIQNIQAFDARHGYEPLPHPLALLPQNPNMKRRKSLTSQTALRNLKLGRAVSIPEPKITAYHALAMAANSLKNGGVHRQLVQEYQRFERQKLDAKLDIVEARKVRWLLIYSVLQMLSSIMRGPKEVVDAETASYPVCVLTTGCPVIDVSDGDAVKHDSAEILEPPPTATLIPEALDALEGRSSRISIHPDCEANSAEDFFASNVISRQESELSLSQLSLQHRAATMPLSRTGSLRSSMQFSVQALHKSLVGGLNRKNSRRASLPVEPRQKPLYCEIVVEDYGNGIFIHEEEADIRPQAAVRAIDGATPEPVDMLQGFDFGFTPLTIGPALDLSQLEINTVALDASQNLDQSPCESHFSTTSADLLDSNRSSYLRDSDSSDTDMSSLEDDSADSDVDTPVDYKDPDQSEDVLFKEHLYYRPKHRHLGVSAACWSVNAGCYAPTGLIVPPTSKFSSRERPSSSISTTSSNYPEESNQAADIEEDEMRGRQRSRAMDSFARRAPTAQDITAY